MMRLLRYYRRTIALPTVVIFMLWSLPHGTSQAAMISTEQVTAASNRNADEARAHVLRTLRRADVQAEMRTLGIDPAEAAARVNAMSDGEVRDIAGRMNNSPAGGHVYTMVLIIAGAVALVAGLLAWLTHRLVSSPPTEKQSPPPRTR